MGAAQAVGASGNPSNWPAIARSASSWHVIFSKLDVNVMVHRLARYLYTLLKVAVLLIFLFDRLRRIYRRHRPTRRVLIHYPLLQQGVTHPRQPKVTVRLYRWIRLAYLLGRSTWG